MLMSEKQLLNSASHFAGDLTEKSFAYSDIYEGDDVDASETAQLNWLVKVVTRHRMITLEDAKEAYVNTALTWRNQVLQSKDSDYGQQVLAANTDIGDDPQAENVGFASLVTDAIKKTNMRLTANSEGKLCLFMSR